MQVSQGDVGGEEPAGAMTDKQEGDGDMGESMDDLANDYHDSICRLVTEFTKEGDAAAEKRVAAEAEVKRWQALADGYAAEERLARDNAIEVLLETPARRQQFGDKGDKAA